MRKLASIRRIGDIQPIPTADQIVCATVDGWKAVIKKDEFHVNEVIVYAEIDSWIPHEVAPFLSKGKEPRVYNDIKGERLRTVNLRGQISQGLILPLSLIKDELIELNLLLTDGSNLDTLLGYDVTELLGIQKYEPILYERYVPKTKDGKPIPPLGKPFPSFFPKTDQERIQNLAGNLNYYKTSAFTWEVTEKLDGCSVTFYYLAESDVFGVCSRNLDLYPLSEDTPTNSPARLYWGMAEQLNILNLFRSANRSIAIQGEIIGEKIQGNLYKLKNQKQFYVFDIYDIPTGKYFSPIERREFCEMFGLLHVPVLETHIVIPMEKTIDEMLKEAEGFSVISNKPNTEREGLVFKCNDRNSSFKLKSDSDAPSFAPSLLPTTADPTFDPSPLPSAIPSEVPSTNPTVSPSATPTEVPTYTPTEIPTATPSMLPSSRPSSLPTRQPTSIPSRLPTSRPSTQPSNRPSSRPSSQPSAFPSAQPSNIPSSRPSISPTSQPTTQPSSHPSTKPSARPSGQPSLQPTTRPSSLPTGQPSSYPSAQPTSRPSGQPSVQPSSKPSGQPSSQPSSKPSQQPSSHPSGLPTNQPSSRPSTQPSSKPTGQPSLQPTSRPSRMPSSQPSGSPSSQPSSHPSGQPSITPTSRPSRQPTSHPTGQPTSQPTRRPSGQPTVIPSAQPSIMPTSRPSGQPTSQPSRQPTSQPSSQPSKQPTSQPTGQPSRQPTSQPSRQPTSQPTGQPSRQPTGQPSRQPTSQPTRQPTRQPTSQPSRQPTSQPTSKPSVPTSQPTNSPTAPTPKPTRRPSRVPTRLPTLFPTSQPTSQPTNPTGQPTNQPSFNFKYFPTLIDQYPTDSFVYYCHPLHLHSTENPFLPIYARLYTNSTVTMSKLTITISPYDPTIDQFSLFPNAQSQSLLSSISSTGVFTLSTFQPSDLTLADWNHILNLPLYQLNLQREKPNSCYKYINGLYKRRFQIMLYDIYQRPSNPVYRNLVVKTATAVYTNANPVRVDNNAAYMIFVATQKSISNTNQFNRTYIT